MRPASNLLATLGVAISRFLETPITWDGNPTADEKRQIIDHIKEVVVSKSLPVLASRRLREQPQPQWQAAYAYRGPGSTRDRRNAVESIYSRWVPIPTGAADADAEEFLSDVKDNAFVNEIWPPCDTEIWPPCG